MLPAHVEQLRDSGKDSPVKTVVSENDEVGIDLLGNAVDGGARRIQADRNAHAVAGAQAVFARQHVDARRGQALFQKLGKGFADPLEAGRVGAVLERDNCGCEPRGPSSLSPGRGTESPKGQEHCDQMKKFQAPLIIVASPGLSPLPACSQSRRSVPASWADSDCR